jgi:2-methylcitrate dehydratase PrpD
MHASQLVAFASAAVSAKLLGHSDEQLTHALGIIATTVGGLGVGTNSWAREYMGANAAFTGVQAALSAAKGFTVSDDLIDGRGGFIDVFGGGAPNVGRLTADLGQSWNIDALARRAPAIRNARSSGDGSARRRRRGARRGADSRRRPARPRHVRQPTT